MVKILIIDLVPSWTILFLKDGCFLISCYNTNFSFRIQIIVLLIRQSGSMDLCVLYIYIMLSFVLTYCCILHRHKLGFDVHQRFALVHWKWDRIHHISIHSLMEFWTNVRIIIFIYLFFIFLFSGYVIIYMILRIKSSESLVAKFLFDGQCSRISSMHSLLTYQPKISYKEYKKDVAHWLHQWT